MNDYEDIIDLPHHVSEKHAPMPMLNRAAQFAPFAALTGYDPEGNTQYSDITASDPGHRDEQD